MQYPFGWGLSYTTFSYVWANATALPGALPVAAFGPGGASPLPPFEVRGVAKMLGFAARCAKLQSC